MSPIAKLVQSAVNESAQLSLVRHAISLSVLGETVPAQSEIGATPNRWHVVASTAIAAPNAAATHLTGSYQVHSVHMPTNGEGAQTASPQTADILGSVRFLTRAVRFFVTAVAISLAAPVLAADIAVSSAVPAQSARTGSIQTPDGDLYYEMHGEGPPIILVAGGPGASRTSMRPEFDQLAEKHTVVYFDNIGRGRSSDLTADKHHSPYRDADDIEQLRKALRFEQFALIGHSYGGRPAMVYAVRHPERLTHLVLSSSGYSHESSQRNIDAVNHFIASQYPETWDQLLSLRARGMTSCDSRYQELYGKPIAQLYWHDPAKIGIRPSVSTDPRDSFRLKVYCDMLGDDPEVIVGGSMATFDIRAALADVRVPTLITSGRHDPVVPPREARELARAFPPGVATLRIFEDSSHRPWVEQGALYFSELNAFLDRLGPQAH